MCFDIQDGKILGFVDVRDKKVEEKVCLKVNGKSNKA